MEDRNPLNQKIEYFEQIEKELEKISKVVFQDGKFAKDFSYKLANEKEMSSYPNLQEMFLEADRVALDSPWKFASICADAADAIHRKIAQIKKERKTLVEETLPQKMKGWVDRHSK
jgi:hypothetical protein